MKNQYIEAGVLTIVYLVISLLTLNSFETENTVLTIITYPAKICLEPIMDSNFRIEKMNLSLFALYFLWSFSCVYLNMIKTTMKQLSLISLKKL